MHWLPAALWSILCYAAVAAWLAVAGAPVGYLILLAPFSVSVLLVAVLLAGEWRQAARYLWRCRGRLRI